MFRSIVAVLFVALALLQATSAVDISKYKNIRLELNDNDAVPNTRLFGDERAQGFIGDIQIGQRYSDENVFRRLVEFDNPTDVVQTSTLNLSVSNGVIHYVNARNQPNSYAVACVDSTNVGTPGKGINFRVAPRSKAALTLIVAAH
ncbi:uncharacterized protein LOC143345429 [Colletes latitarsis]|uniref:uncharacterized protein LOC143345429 n=1 Tax=Colletes latitarsis TaxID=2605962 RepID=UPI004035426D